MKFRCYVTLRARDVGLSLGCSSELCSWPLHPRLRHTVRLPSDNTHSNTTQIYCCYMPNSAVVVVRATESTKANSDVILTDSLRNIQCEWPKEFLDVEPRKGLFQLKPSHAAISKHFHMHRGAKGLWEWTQPKSWVAVFRLCCLLFNKWVKD